MDDVLLALKTDEALLQKLRTAASHQTSPEEILEQRISFVYGSMKARSGVTRDRVRQVILEQDGAPHQAGR